MRNNRLVQAGDRSGTVAFRRSVKSPLSISSAERSLTLSPGSPVHVACQRLEYFLAINLLRRHWRLFPYLKAPVRFQRHPGTPLDDYMVEAEGIDKPF